MCWQSSVMRSAGSTGLALGVSSSSEHSLLIYLLLGVGGGTILPLSLKGRVLVLSNPDPSSE
jgi:hypothetical protein